MGYAIIERCHYNDVIMRAIGEFPAQKAINAENFSIWWRHHAMQFELQWKNGEMVHRSGMMINVIIWSFMEIYYAICKIMLRSMLIDHVHYKTRHENISDSLQNTLLMMASSNGNIFDVTGSLCGQFTGRRWIPRKKSSDAELWCFLWSVPEQTQSKQ